MNVTAKTTTIVLKGARVLDPVEGLDQTADIRISDGVIEAIGPNLPAAETTVDCKGMIVTPGLIDGHVHLGPRREDGEGEAAPIRDVVKILRPGDVVTHLFTGYPGGLLDDNGRLQPEVKEAYVNGLRFDVGHGLYNMSFDTAARVLDQGIEPHSISTDGHKVARQRLVYDLPTTMAKMMNLGFTLPQLVNKATYEAAT